MCERKYVHFVCVCVCGLISVLWCVYWSRECIDPLSSSWVWPCTLILILPVCVCVCVYLVGVVRVDEVECAGRGAAERCGAANVRLLGVRGLWRSVGVRQLVEGRERRRGRRRGREDGRGHGGQAAQPIGHRVRVELDLRVVEVLLAVTAVRVTVTPKDTWKHTEGIKDKFPCERWLLLMCSVKQNLSASIICS